MSDEAAAAAAIERWSLPSVEGPIIGRKMGDAELRTRSGEQVHDLDGLHLISIYVVPA